MKRRTSSTSPASRNAPARCGPPSSRIDVTRRVERAELVERRADAGGLVLARGDDDVGAGHLERLGRGPRRGARHDDGQRDPGASLTSLESTGRRAVESKTTRRGWWWTPSTARGELRVVGQRGADPDGDGVDLRAPPMGAAAAALARDPLGVAGARGDLPVERHGRLEEHPGPPGAGVLAEGLVDQPRGAGRARRRPSSPRRPRRAGSRGRGRWPSRSGRRRRRRRG